MGSGSQDWTALASQHERLVSAGDRGEAPRPVPQPGPHRRARRVAAGASLTLLAAAAAVPAVTAQAGAATRPAAAGSWRIVKTVHGGGAPQFTAVTAPSPTAAWGFAAGSGRPSAWRLSGTKFRKAPFPGKDHAVVAAAASTSGKDVWAAEVSGSTTRILRFNGHAWSSTGSVSDQINDLVAVSRSNVWAFFGVGAGTPAGTWHFNGKRWSRVSSGHGLYAGGAASAHSIWAVSGKRVAHWTGHRWARASVASLLPGGHLSSPFLTGICPLSTHNVWAVGTGGREDEGGPLVVLHFNGHRWRRVATGDGFGNPALAQVTPDGHGGLWIPVPFSDGRPFTMVHFAHGALHAATLPLPGSRLDVAAIAEVRGLSLVLGGGAEYQKNEPGVDQSAVLLAFEG